MLTFISNFGVVVLIRDSVYNNCMNIKIFINIEKCVKTVFNIVIIV